MHRPPAIHSVTAGLIVFFASAAALAAEPTLEAPGQDPLISNGTPTQMCQFPTTVLMFDGFSICTGTLIHPQIVTQAAHCAYVNTVRFGESFNSIYREVSVDFCMRNPEWDPNDNNGVNGGDYAFCKLNQPINDIPITPPVMGCELDMLEPNEPAMIVGFGANMGEDGAGTKRWAETIIQTPVLQDSESVAVGENGTAGCGGDSGGPAYYQYPDGTWHTFGIVSGGPPCGSGADLYSLIHRAVPFIEANSGVDVTPCHDADGTWNPSPDCGGFATNIPSPNASPNQGCSTEVSGLLATCGPANGAPPDLNPPFVSIESPENNANIEANTAVDIVVDAVDPEFGVDSVELLIDGQSVSTDTVEPWVFEDATFPAGTYELVAVAEDWFGNSAQSLPVTLIVGDGGTDTGEPPDPDTGDGDGDGDSESDSDSDGDTGGTSDGDTGTSAGESGGGFPGSPNLDDEGCACSSSGEPGRGGALGFGLGLLALVSLRRRRG